MAVVEHVDPGTLPPKGARMLQHVYTSQRRRGLSKRRAAQSAWAEVGRYYYKRGSRWHRRKREANPSKRKATKRKATKRKATKRKATKRKATKRNPMPRIGTPVARAPVQLAGESLSDLGDVLEIRAGDHVLRWKRGHPLLWHPESRSLVILHGAKVGRRKAAANPRGRAARAFESWSQRDVEHERTDRMPALREGWRRIGAASYVAYWSDKFNTTDDYEHPFSSRVTLYRAGGPRPPWIWVLRGGKLNVTARGIVG